MRPAGASSSATPAGRSACAWWTTNGRGLTGYTLGGDPFAFAKDTAAQRRAHRQEQQLERAIAQERADLAGGRLVRNEHGEPTELTMVDDGLLLGQDPEQARLIGESILEDQKRRNDPPLSDDEKEYLRLKIEFGWKVPRAWDAAQESAWRLNFSKIVWCAPCFRNTGHR